MIFVLFFVFIFSIHCQTFKQFDEISINEELSIGAIVTFLNDKIPNIDQASEYGFVQPSTSDLDVFSIDHERHTINIKKRLDYEQICSKVDPQNCLIPISIAVTNNETIYVYNIPIRIKNIDDNPIKFPVNRTIIEIDENDNYWFNKSYLLPHAYDADGDQINYSLYLQNWNEPHGLFDLDKKRLVLKPLKKFDREEQNLYLLRLVAENQYQKDVSIDVIVIIKDVNDHSPKCEHNEMLFTINAINSLSIFKFNVTDLDENDNGKLEFSLMNSSPGFSIDRFNGFITFNYAEWKLAKQTKLYINISDFGKPYRQSTQCIVEFKLTFLYDITLKLKNERNNYVYIENFDLPIGQLNVFDKEEKRYCDKCSIELKSSLSDLVYLNETTKNFHLNVNSSLLINFLSNSLIKTENFPITINIYASDANNPLIISSKNYSFIFNLNREKLLKNSNSILIKIPENFLLNEKFSLTKYFHSCLINQTYDLMLFDSTNTFDIDKNNNLLLKKHLNIKQQQTYNLLIQNNQTDETNSCSMKFRIHVYNPYSTSKDCPYFSQSFYILTSTNIPQFVLPSLPSDIKYKSSKPNEILINENNASITIQTPSLFSKYSYDFSIEAFNFQIPSSSCSIPIRIYFGINQYPPKVLNNSTRQTIVSSSTDFVYQIQAYDPDLLLTEQKTLYPPSIEYEIDSNDNIQIERYTGRINLINNDQSMYNFTVIITDFGQPNRLTTRQRIIFDISPNQEIFHQEIPLNNSTTFVLIGSCVFSIIMISIIVIILLNGFYHKFSTNKSISNISPTTHDSCLIDNEYITTTTSLPRIANREQRIYPTNSNDNQRKLLEQIQLPPPSLYSNEQVSNKYDYQHTLSMNDINKYLERFEKIYNNSSEYHLGEPVGSVV